MRPAGHARLLLLAVLAAACTPFSSSPPPPAPTVVVPIITQPPGARVDPDLPRVGTKPIGPLAQGPAPAPAALALKPTPISAPGCRLLDLIDQAYRSSAPLDAQQARQLFGPCLAGGGNEVRPVAAGSAAEQDFGNNSPVKRLSVTENKRYDTLASADARSIIRLNMNFERFCASIEPIETLRLKNAGSGREIVRRPIYSQALAYPPGYERISTDRSRIAFYAIDNEQCVRGVIIVYGATNLRMFPAPKP